ncbi:MAG: BrnT family toxin [Methylococcaceae bacterium]
MEFEWNENKAGSTFQKHGVTFDEAKTVFDDSLASIFDDIWHSIDEQRELIIGMSNKAKLLVVSFTERTDGVIRIISARMATAVEIKNHERTNKH